MTRRNLEEKWYDDNKSFLALNIKNKMLPTIYGLIIGDLIGVPVEFKDRDTYTITDITGYGTYNQPPGTWSDDTSLTLCLMKSIKENGDLSTLMYKFERYKSEGYCTPYSEMFDIGRTTLESINRFKSGIKPQECGGSKEFDNGNGALMRIAPLTFSLIEEFNFKKKVNIIKSYTEITHAHPRSIVGSIIYIELLLRLYHNNTLFEGLSQIKELFTRNFDTNSVQLKEFSNYSRIFHEDFLKTSVNDIQSDGYVVHTLEAAIWCFGNSNSFKEAVLKAVNLGGDTDTVASITGALAGMYYKMQEIPEDWLSQIANKKMIDNIINEFYNYCSNKIIIEEYGSL